MKIERLIVPALVAASSLSTAEIVINDFLAFEGFVDMSYSHTDTDFDGDKESDNSFAVDQVEISWLFDFDPVTAQIDLEYEDADDATNVEQAFATYDLGNGAAITAGRYASMLGFEAFEPTGLYQYSFAYDIHDAGALQDSIGLSDGNAPGDVTLIPRYAQGVKYTYETETTFFGISLQDEVFDYDGDRLGGDDASGYGVEVALSIAFGNGLSCFVGGAFEEADEAAGDSYVLNAYVTYETGAWLFAAEANYGESEASRFALGAAASDFFGAAVTDLEEEVFQALIMANYAYSERASVTGRISYVDHEHEAGIEAEGVKYTLAHGYAFTDNLLLVNELSLADGDADILGVSGDYESLLFATELIFSF